MAKYIMERLASGMHGEGERLFPRLVNGQVIDTASVAEAIEHRTSFTHGDVVGLLSALAAVVEEAVVSGHSVKIDDLGVFHPVLGLVEKEERGEWTDASKRLTTGRNVRLKTIAFRPDAALVRSAAQSISLERANDRMGRKQPTSTLAERTEAARQYIAEHNFMHIADYAALVGLPHSTAAIELRQIAAEATSGITTSGRGPAKIYVSKA